MSNPRDSGGGKQQKGVRISLKINSNLLALLSGSFLLIALIESGVSRVGGEWAGVEE